jgi:hypothetical protein
VHDNTNRVQIKRKQHQTERNAHKCTIVLQTRLLEQSSFTTCKNAAERLFQAELDVHTRKANLCRLKVTF